MPYQRSTQASGFRRRTAPDESKQLRQYATALDNSRKENVQGMERQGVQMSNEMTRVDALASKKDAYELQSLRNFSKTLNNFLATAAEDVIKPITENQIEKGINDGVRAAQGDKSALERIKLSEEQVEQIRKDVEIQREKVLKTAKGIEQTWDDSNYKASLEEKYRLLNLKKLGGNHAHGMRIGMLTAAANGWDAFRDSVLTDNPEVALSQEMLPGTGLKVGEYNSYNSDEKKAILAYVQKRYILEKGAGLRSDIVNKYLTRPILEKTGAFQNKEYEREHADWGAETEQDLAARFEASLEGIDTDTTALKTSIEEMGKVYPSVSKARNLAGSSYANTKKFIIEQIVAKGSALKTGPLTNVDDHEDFIQFANTVPIYIEGITPKGGKPLFKIWPADLNEASLRYDFRVAASDKAKKHKAAMEGLAQKEWEEAYGAYKEDGIEANYNARMKMVEEKYDGYITPFMKNSWHGIKEIGIMPVKQAESLLANDIFRDENTVLFLGDKSLAKVPKVLIDKYIEKGQILTKTYEFPQDEAEHLKQVGNLEAFIIDTLNEATGKGLGSEVLNGKFTKDSAQVKAYVAHVTPKILKRAWGIYDEASGETPEDQGITLSQALEQAAIEIKGELSTNPLYTMSAEKGFTSPVFNASVVDPATTTLNNRFKYQVDTVQKAITLSRENYGVNVFNSPEIDLIVDRVEAYKLNNKGGLAKVWEDLEAQTGIPREILYNWQAEKLDPALGIKKKVWSQEVEDKLTLWKKTNAADWANLNSGDSARIGRALTQLNVIDVESVARTVIDMNTGYLPVSSSEYQDLLNDLGLDSSISYEEFLSKPELMADAFKLKTANLIDEVETMTNNPRDGVRMVLAGLKYGDVNLYNTDEANGLYTVYQTDDTDVLSKVNSKFNMNPYKTSIKFDTDRLDFYNEEEVSTFNTVEDIDQALVNLDGEIPDKVIEVSRRKAVSAGPFSNWLGMAAGADKKFMVNPEYTSYINHKQRLNDRKSIIQFLQTPTLGDASPQTAFHALRRVFGEDRLDQILTLAEKVSGRPRDDYGFIQREDVVEVLKSQEEFAQAVNLNAYTTNQTEDGVTNDLSAYEPGGGLIGNIGERDLTEVEGHYGSKIAIRNDVADSLLQMKDAATRDGIFLRFNDGYRDNKTQTRIYNEWLQGKHPDTPHVATPGTSEHESGKAVDFDLRAMANQESFSEKAVRVAMDRFGFSSRQDALDALRKEYADRTYEWLVENGAQYGFEQSFTSGENREDWHWRFNPALLNKGDVN